MKKYQEDNGGKKPTMLCFALLGKIHKQNVSADVFRF